MIGIQTVFTKLRAIDNRTLAVRELHRALDRELKVKQDRIPINRHDHANQSPYWVYAVSYFDVP
jgi:hypothetical protein